MNLPHFIQIITIYVLLYPFLMGFFWVFGAILYNIKYTNKDDNSVEIPETKITILVPIYNEEEGIVSHVNENLKLNYSNYELWLIDDQSTDSSYQQIKSIVDEKVFIYQNEANIGKAATLNKYMKKVDTDYFIVVDSDTVLDVNALKAINRKIHSTDQLQYAGYTGNITVYDPVDSNQKMIVLQKIEYRAFIDAIKRTQFVLTKSIMTLSGAFTCYKKSAIEQLGGFNTTNATEDINISWQLNQAGQKLCYVEDAYCKVLTPDTVLSLVNQRKRWTLGLLQTILDKQNFKNYNKLSLIYYFIEIILSSVWVFLFAISTLYYYFMLITSSFENLIMKNFIFGIVLLLISSSVLAVFTYIIGKNEKESILTFIKTYFYLPVIYFGIQVIGYMTGLKSFIFGEKSGLWRREEKIKEAFLFATLTDLFFILLYPAIIAEILKDNYNTFNMLDKADYLLIFIGLKLLYLIIYFAKEPLGNRFTNYKFSKRYNLALYVLLIGILINVNDYFKIIKLSSTRLTEINLLGFGDVLIIAIILILGYRFAQPKIVKKLKD